MLNKGPILEGPRAEKSDKKTPISAQPDFCDRFRLRGLPLRPYLHVRISRISGRTAQLPQTIAIINSDLIPQYLLSNQIRCWEGGREGGIPSPTILSGWIINLIDIHSYISTTHIYPQLIYISTALWSDSTLSAGKQGLARAVYLLRGR